MQEGERVTQGSPDSALQALLGVMMSEARPRGQCPMLRKVVPTGQVTWHCLMGTIHACQECGTPKPLLPF